MLRESFSARCLGEMEKGGKENGTGRVVCSLTIWEFSSVTFRLPLTLAMHLDNLTRPTLSSNCACAPLSSLITDSQECVKAHPEEARAGVSRPTIKK